VIAPKAVGNSPDLADAFSFAACTAASYFVNSNAVSC
jgi:hypothetical protein